jgi:hypothetical protein
VTRNVTLINVTKNVTKYEIINGRRFNRGPDVVEIERRIGRPIPRLRLAEVADRRLHGPHGDRLNVYRPSLPERRHGAWTAMDRAIMAAHPSDQSEAAARATENARRPQSANARSRFVTEPPRALTAAEIQERRRQLETHHQRLQAEMDRRHARELEATAPGPMREQLLARQAAERQAFALQRQRMMAAAMNAQPSTVRRASAPMRRRS